MRDYFMHFKPQVATHMCKAICYQWPSHYYYGSSTCLSFKITTPNSILIVMESSQFKQIMRLRIGKKSLLFNLGATGYL